MTALLRVINAWIPTFDADLYVCFGTVLTRKQRCVRFESAGTTWLFPKVYEESWSEAQSAASAVNRGGQKDET